MLGKWLMCLGQNNRFFFVIAAVECQKAQWRNLQEPLKSLLWIGCGGHAIPLRSFSFLIARSRFFRFIRSEETLGFQTSHLICG